MWATSATPTPFHRTRAATTTGSGLSGGRRRMREYSRSRRGTCSKVRSARLADPVHFGELVLPHVDAAYNLARWMTRNSQDAEDVVQDAGVRAPAACCNALPCCTRCMVDAWR